MAFLFVNDAKVLPSEQKILPLLESKVLVIELKIYLHMKLKVNTAPRAIWFVREMTLALLDHEINLLQI